MVNNQVYIPLCKKSKTASLWKNHAEHGVHIFHAAFLTAAHGIAIIDICPLDTIDSVFQCRRISEFRTVVYTDDPSAFKYYRIVKAEAPEQFNEYVSKCKELSLYDTGVTAEYGDKLITLSTCEYSHQNGRIVVVAKKIVSPSAGVSGDEA